MMTAWTTASRHCSGTWPHLDKFYQRPRAIRRVNSDDRRLRIRCGVDFDIRRGHAELLRTKNKASSQGSDHKHHVTTAPCHHASQRASHKESDGKKHAQYQQCDVRRHLRRAKASDKGGESLRRLGKQHRKCMKTRASCKPRFHLNINYNSRCARLSAPIVCAGELTKAHHSPVPMPAKRNGRCIDPPEFHIPRGSPLC